MDAVTHQICLFRLKVAISSVAETSSTLVIFWIMNEYELRVDFKWKQIMTVPIEYTDTIINLILETAYGE